MSARYLKKVLKEQEALLKQQQEQEHQNSDEESESPEASAPFVNPFDLLNENDDNHDIDEEEESIVDEHLLPSKKVTTSNVLTNNQKSKKKKKKKSKSDTLTSNSETSLKNLSIGKDSSVTQSTDSKPINLNGNHKKQSESSILQVDPKFLSAENELRRIFGSKVVNSFEKSQQVGSSRQVRGNRRGSHTHRRTILVSPSEHWPRYDGSLSMELLETKEGVNYFKYVHSSSYSQAQRAFEAAKAIHDLNGIASILLNHPYHIDSLITLADYFKFTGEHQMSADATAKCLYALECAWHPMFTPLQGNSQLKYSHEVNKMFFTSLFTHMKNMDRRGCHRSALEICKLLLSLDSDDPVGARFCIDYYALRSEEYFWLEQFSEKYQKDNSLWLFPNFSFSLAVCRFYLENGEDKTEKEDEKASSSDLMKQAIMLHPSILKKLVVKVPLKDQAWNGIVKSSFFRSETDCPSLDHLINIYVERSYIIWRLPDLQKFLRDSALSVMKNLEDKGNDDARDWACVRKEAFSSNENEYRHLSISDFSDSAPTIPPEMLQNMAVDPRMGGGGGGGGMMDEQGGNQVVVIGGGGGVPRDLSNRNAFAVLLESILPWVDYGRGEEDHQNDEHQEHFNDELD